MTFFLQAFVTLFVIIDPPGIVPLFLGLTRGRSVRTRRRLAWQAAVVAFGVIVAFALFGRVILNYTQVQLAALEGAGGLLLLLVSLQLLPARRKSPPPASAPSPTWRSSRSARRCSPGPARSWRQCSTCSASTARCSARAALAIAAVARGA